MNNSDFLSDAVALDLGKSGVKVAETLEIEVGDEWWRLINAADVTDAQVFQKRRTPDPVIEGGEIKLASYKTNLIPAGSGSTVSNNLNGPFSGMAFVTGEDNPLFYTVYHELSTGNFPLAAIYNSEGTLVKTIASYKTSAVAQLFDAFWDNTNQRILAVAVDGSYIRTTYAAITATEFKSAGVSYKSTLSSGYVPSKVFPECQESIYTLFQQVGALLVKKTTPTVGQSATSVSSSVINISGGTTITVATNYASGEAYIFYSRKYESVGVAWVDATDRNIYFALESESWSTAHFLTQKTATTGVKMTSFGNLIIPKEVEGGGEYLTVGLREQNDGNLGLPVGFSFPVNFTIISASHGTADDFRLLGAVGQNLYMYIVEYDGMEIVKTPNYPFYVSFDPSATTTTSSYELVKVAESGNREIFFLQVYGQKMSTGNHDATLVCYDKGTGEIIWVWGNSEWSSSSIFPSTYGSPGYDWYNWKQQVLQRIDQYVVFMQFNRTGSAGTVLGIENYWVPITSILACNSEADVTATMTVRKYQNIYNLNIADRAISPMRPPSWQNTSILWGDTGLAYYFMINANDTYNEIRIFSIDKSTLTFSGVTDKILRGYASTSRPSIGGVKFISNDRSYEMNFSLEDSGLDPYVRSLLNETSLQFLDSENVAKKTVSNIFGGIPVSVAVNEKEVAYYPSASGKVVYLSGATFSGTSVQRRFSIPHTFYKYMVSEFDDKMVFLGNIVSGEIPYTLTSCFEADSTKSLAINATDFTDTYFVNKDFNAVGGEHTMLPYGSWILYRDASSRMVIIQTGAPITDFMGGAVGDTGGESEAIIFDYLNCQFIPYPFAREGIRAELSNISKTTKITLPETQDHLIRGMLAAGTDFRGSRCILRRVFPDHIDEPGADIVLLDGYIQDWSYVPEKSGIAFTVSKTLIDVGGQFPKRLMNMGCSHVFKGDRCQYLGEEGRCLKTKAFCTSLENLNQFGGFPWVAARQRRVMWK